MKLAIFSDIHSNLEALTAVLEDIERRNIAKSICLGDVVGYGANPKECLDLIRLNEIPCLIGNHDQAVFDDRVMENFREMAKGGIVYTRSHITKDDIEFLSSLPYSMDLFGQTFVHASPDHPEFFRYILSREDALEQFYAFTTQLCFIGHTHRPAIFCEDYLSTKIIRGKKFIVNVGSVGQPRDGEPRACYCIYDDEQYSTEFVRVEYDVEATCSKILTAGLPAKLADRLLVGV